MLVLATGLTLFLVLIILLGSFNRKSDKIIYFVTFRDLARTILMTRQALGLTRLQAVLFFDYFLTKVKHIGEVRARMNAIIHR